MNGAQKHPPIVAKAVKIDYGHDDECVVVIFSHPTPNIRLTPGQTDDMIAALQNAKARLAEHKAKRNG